MLCVVNTLVMATSWPFMGTWSTLAKIEFLSSLVTTILVPLQTPLVMLRRAMTGAPTLSLRTWAGSRPSLMLDRYSSGYWSAAWAFWSVVLLGDMYVCAVPGTFDMRVTFWCWTTQLCSSTDHAGPVSAVTSCTSSSHSGASQKKHLVVLSPTSRCSQTGQQLPALPRACAFSCCQLPAGACRRVLRA